MDDSKFLVLGGNGQLGKALQVQYPNAHVTDVAELDITDKTSLQQFNWSGVSTILNAAAYTNVDGAETPDGRLSAWKINAMAVGQLASIALKHDLTLVHISTEYVFDGSKKVHQEDEPLSPLSVYAQTKAAAEIAAAIVPKHYICRTSWLIGEGNNFVRTMLNLAKNNVSPTIVADQIGRLTFTSTLVKAIDHLLNSSAPYGVYNITNDGQPASWSEITRLIFQELGRKDLNITDTTTKDYFANKPEAAPRPLHSTMDLTKIKSTGLDLADWHDELKTYIKKGRLK